MTKDTTTRPELADPQSAFDVALTAGFLFEPVVREEAGRTVILHPNTTQVSEILHPHALPPSIWQRVTVDTRDSLVNYANRFSNDRSVIVADVDAGTVSARLDWHGHNGGDDPLTAGHDAHSATLVLRPSEEFARWDKFEGALHSQVEFAAFLEENAVDVVDPEPAALIEISRDLEVTQGATFKASNRLENGDRTFVYETETRVKGDVTVPREFCLDIPIYQGEDPVSLRCALRFRPTAEGLKLGFEWRRVEYLRLAHFTAIATAAAEATGLPVFFGRAR